MKRTVIIPVLLSCLSIIIIGLNSCAGSQKEIIPSSEFAPYINAYTGGVISQSSPIRIELTQDQPVVDLNNELKETTGTLPAILPDAVHTCYIGKNFKGQIDEIRVWKKALEQKDFFWNNTLNKFNLSNIPIILAGGIWNLSEWKDYINNPEIGKIAFQFGTRPMITKESPVSKAWQKVMMQVKKGDVILQQFSPTGFFSSAIKNSFLSRLMERKDGEIAFSKEQNEAFSHALAVNKHKTVYIRAEDAEKADKQMKAGYTNIQETPDETIVFMTPEEVKQMKTDRANCLGCLSQCQFSTWSKANGTTGKLPDPRSYCIHKTLYDVGHNGSVKDNLLFAGHQVYRFATDPLYRQGVPTVKELINAILAGK